MRRGGRGGRWARGLWEGTLDCEAAAYTAIGCGCVKGSRRCSGGCGLLVVSRTLRGAVSGCLRGGFW